MIQDAAFMQRALDLAELGLGSVSPNPLVGCVIVHDGRIIGEGYHETYGMPHAEVNAIHNVKHKNLLKESTAYVTLEPCSHFGKTPPCVDLLIKHNLKRVVIAHQDPFDLVNGKGLMSLRNAGIDVKLGCLKEKAAYQNRRFFKSVIRQKPYVILKWAESSDGYMNLPEKIPTKISGQMAAILNHKWRSEEDAILIGYSTARIDNPNLNTRLWQGKNPHRYVLDPRAALPTDLKVFQDLEQTTVLTTANPTEILAKIALKHQSLIVEGGSKTLNSFIEANCFDEIRIFKSRNALGYGLPAPKLPGHLKTIKQNLGSDFLYIYNEN